LLRPPWSKAAWFDAMRTLVIRALFCLILLASGVVAQSTSDALLSESENQIESVRSKFKAVQAVVGTDGVADEQLQQQRDIIETLKLESAVESKKLNGPLNEVREQLKRLGPPPKTGETEAAVMANQRRLLDTRISRLEASQKQLELVRVEADQTVTRILTVQRDRFFERIFRSDKSVLNPGLWVETWSGITQFSSRLSTLLGRWWSDVAANANFAGLLLLPAVGGVLIALWQVLKRRIRRRLDGLQPIEERRQLSALTRLMRIAAGMLAALVIVVFGNILVTASFALANLMTVSVEPLFEGFASIVSQVVLDTALAYFLCAPRRPEARLISIDERSAKTLPLLVAITTLIYAVSTSLSDISNLLNLPVNLTAGQTALSAAAMIIFLGLILVVLRRQADRSVAEDKSYFLSWFVQTLPFIWILLGISALALVLGYISLAYFITGNIFDTALFIVLFAVIHYLADAASDNLLNPASRLGLFSRNMLGLTEKGVSRLSLVFRTVVDILLVLIAIPALFGIWALTWIDVTSVLAGFFNGFTIGNITISPWGLLIALLVLVIGVILTRFITGWLQRRVLSETTMDKGVQASITTASSYAGYIVAFALALSAAGLDFSNIAIIAGALGVGIGFGLQSIVNNFVSGLILLAERPVRVGDWVATNAGEGIVRKINVRSTEIETFDSCTVIVPNSNLVTDAVRNWTHRDTVGRFTVVVTVEGQSKIDVTADTLRDILRAHPKVLRYPEPQITLSRFMPTGLEFELKGFVSDVFEAVKVASDIRFSIVRDLNAKNIQLAFTPTAASEKKPKAKS
jgi:potassium-dependent mechanosensitive channel